MVQIGLPITFWAVRVTHTSLPMPCSCCTELFCRTTAFKFCKVKACELSHVWPFLKQASKAHLTALRQEDIDRKRAKLSYNQFVELVVSTYEADKEQARQAAYDTVAEQAQGSAPRARKSKRAQHGQDGAGACLYINGQVVWKKTFTVDGRRERAEEMWRLETACLKKAKHLGIVPLLHASDALSLSFVCEYISSIRLEAAITHNKDLGTRLCMVLAHSLVCGLDSLHSIGIVHGDLHQANVMLRAHVWCVVFVDFADANKHPKLNDCEHCSDLLLQLGQMPPPLDKEPSAWLHTCMAAHNPDPICLRSVMASKPPIAMLSV